MKELVIYLNFDGNCREAMQFYAAALGGKLDVMNAGDAAPGNSGAGAGEARRVMHARLSLPNGGALMASDIQGGMFSPLQAGNNFSVSVDCSSAAEQDSLFNMLGEGGRTTMELQHTFWGARFGMLIDKFGIHWMFNLDEPKQGQDAG